MAHGAEGAAKAGNWQSPFRQLPGSRGAWGKHSQQSRAQGEGGREGKPVWAHGQGWRGCRMWETGKESSEERGKGSCSQLGMGKQRAGDRDAAVPQVQGVQIFHDFPFPYRKDFPAFQEGFPTPPREISCLSRKDFLSHLGRISHLCRRDSLSLHEGFPLLQEKFPISSGRIPTPPGGNFTIL